MEGEASTLYKESGCVWWNSKYPDGTGWPPSTSARSWERADPVPVYLYLPDLFVITLVPAKEVFEQFSSSDL